MTTTVSANAAVNASASTPGSAAAQTSGKMTASVDFMAIVQALNAENDAPVASNTLTAVSPGTALPNTALPGAALPGNVAVAKADTAANPVAAVTLPGDALPASQSAVAGSGIVSPPVDANPAAITAAPLLQPAATLPAPNGKPPALPVLTASQPNAGADQLNSSAATKTVDEEGLTTTGTSGDAAAALPPAASSRGPISITLIGQTTAGDDAQITQPTPPAVSSAVSAPASVDDTAAVSPDILILAGAAKGWSASTTLLPVTAGQKLPAAKAGDADPSIPEPPKSPLDSNALTQAAALTVTTIALVVPVAAPVVAGKASASQPVDAQFSAFTSSTAQTQAPATAFGAAGNTAAANSDEGSADDSQGDDQASSTAGAGSTTFAGVDSDSPAAAAPTAVAGGSADGFGQSRFSSAVNEVLSLAQAGVRSEKDDKPATDDASAGPVAGNNTALSSSGLTLTRQESGQGFVTSLASASATTAASPLVYASPVDQVSIIMQRAAADQTSSMTISLNPAELGRVEVSLKFGKNGSVQANVIADKAGTLELLQKDQSSLQQALATAGLNPDSSSLSFNLRDDQAQQGQQQNFEGSNSPGNLAGDTQNSADSDSQLVTSAIHYTVQDAGNGHINLFV